MMMMPPQDQSRVLAAWPCSCRCPSRLQLQLLPPPHRMVQKSALRSASRPRRCSRQVVPAVVVVPYSNHCSMQQRGCCVGITTFGIMMMVCGWPGFPRDSRTLFPRVARAGRRKVVTRAAPGRRPVAAPVRQTMRPTTIAMTGRIRRTDRPRMTLMAPLAAQAVPTTRSVYLVRRRNSRPVVPGDRQEEAVQRTTMNPRPNPS
mmetsp:Transcript_10490/g.22779  ORF Transcript_10490/g.22779 Transcript_10490/m.22779 type:complete len:203 (+) Transcript_10490:238-846(+)